MWKLLLMVNVARWINFARRFDEKWINFTRRLTAGNRKLSKKRSREKIDGIVSLAQAMGLYARQEAKPPAFTAEDIMLPSW